MVFSSPIFLFVFLPLVLVGAWLCGRRFGNSFLLGASLLFYAAGEPVYVGVLVLSGLVNYGIGLGLAGANGGAKRHWLAAGLVWNLGLLGFFKYWNFALSSLGLLLWEDGGWYSAFPLPIGISFYTFQVLSYLIDLARGQCGVQRNVRDFLLYMTMFPQLIAGPIVRYAQIETQLRERRMTLEGWDAGIRRFIIGFAKKVLVADTMGRVADEIFAVPVEQMNTPLVWCGVVAFTLQIYFDFSGYSDMAIGLGRIFGFSYPENFRYPYVSRSIQEFWRRWHITLSMWFRDYLYIPMGGNRHGRWRTGRNLLTVFVLCGLWHGASWSFVVWGLFHGIFLVLERGGWGRVVEGMPGVLRHGYVLLVVMVGWVFFRVESIGEAVRVIGLLFGWGQAVYGLQPVPLYVTDEWWWFLGVGVLFSAPVLPWLAGRMPVGWEERWWGMVGVRLGLIALFGVSLVWLAAQNYSPFLYFRF